MLAKLLITLSLSFVTMLANAGVVTLTDFELKWGATRQFGGPVTITDRSGQINPFQVMVHDFSLAIDDEGIGTVRFITAIPESGIDFDDVELFGVFGKLNEEMITSFGIGYASDNGSTFDDRFTFEAVHGNSWAITIGASAVPEPATWLLLLLGITGIVFTKHRRKPKHQSQCSASNI